MLSKQFGAEQEAILGLQEELLEIRDRMSNVLNFINGVGPGPRLKYGP